MSQSRFETLLERYQNGEATSAELVEFDRLLRSDPALRTLFVEQALLQAQLHKACEAATAKPAPAWRRRVGWAAGLAAAAMLLLAVGIGLLSWIGHGTVSEVASGLVLIDGEAVTQIPNGSRFEIAGQNSTVVHLPDGSTATLQPGSQGSIRSRTGDVRLAVDLAQGAGTFQVSHGGEQFRVITPVGTVTALGTEFTVKLQPKKKKGSAKVHLALAVNVTEGSVRVDAGGKNYVLAAGENRDFDDGEQNNVDDGNKNDNNNQNNNGDNHNKNDGDQGQGAKGNSGR